MAAGTDERMRETVMVANVSPSALCFGETLSTLKFAQRARLIRNTPVVNEDTSGNSASMRAEIARLTRELAEARGATEGCAAPAEGAQAAGERELRERASELRELVAAAVDERKTCWVPLARFLGVCANLTAVKPFSGLS